ncbi:hypothetical protein ABFX02_06G135000 [Erythranthe guttata]
MYYLSVRLYSGISIVHTTSDISLATKPKKIHSQNIRHCHCLFIYNQSIQKSKLTRDGNGLDLRFFHLLFWHGDSQHPILHRRLHLLQICILRQPESADELAGAPLDTVPLVILLLFLLASLSADLKNIPVFNLNLHFFLLQPGNIHLEQVCLRRLFPVDPSVCHRGCFSSGGG